MPADAHPSQQRVREAAASRGVELDIVTYGVSTHTAAEAAEALGAGLDQIVKSLVFVAPSADGQEVVVALVSGSDRVDVGRLSATVALPGLRRATAQEAGSATGFAIGGIPPFGHTRPVRVVMDPGLERHAVVWAAAGTPNAVFAIAPSTLRSVSDAQVAHIAVPSTSAAPGPTGGTPSS